jgi:hypothetical protein
MLQTAGTTHIRWYRYLGELEKKFQKDLGRKSWAWEELLTAKNQKSKLLLYSLFKQDLTLYDSSLGNLCISFQSHY